MGCRPKAGRATSSHTSCRSITRHGDACRTNQHQSPMVKLLLDTFRYLALPVDAVRRAVFRSWAIHYGQGLAVDLFSPPIRA